MTIRLRLDPGDPDPLFRQLVRAVKRDVATGRLRAGDRLPSVRDLAKTLLVNPNTVAKAYAVLESEGVTVSRRGAGTSVADVRPTMRSDESRRLLRRALEAALVDALHRGLSEEQVRAEFDEALGELAFPRSDCAADGAGPHDDSDNEEAP